MRMIKKWYSRLNIYYKLFPFLLLYLTICFILNNNGWVGDEKRYILFANNLLHGFLSKQYEEINLMVGPGYSLLLAPMIFLKLPIIVLKLLNGFLLYFSLIISYKTFRFYSTPKNSFLFTVFLGSYYPIFEMLPLLFTECLTWFLISLVCYLVIKNFEKEKISWKYLIFASFTIAYLAMTKVIFGYVISLMSFISIIMLLLPTLRSWAKKPALIFSLSFAFCLPWLIYTYCITNIPFYWAYSGSDTLYSMSTPYPDELGDWKSYDELKLNPNHKALMEKISNLNVIEKNKILQKEAIQNIESHPLKYFYNWIANVGRIVFSYPYSNAKQTINTYFTIIPNMFVVVFIILSLAFSIAGLRKIPKEIFFLFLFIMIYLFGSSLVSSERRMFIITIPFWFLFFTFVLNKIILIKIRN